MGHSAVNETVFPKKILLIVPSGDLALSTKVELFKNTVIMLYQGSNSNLQSLSFIKLLSIVNSLDLGKVIGMKLTITSTSYLVLKKSRKCS